MKKYIERLNEMIKPNYIPDSFNIKLTIENEFNYVDLMGKPYQDSVTHDHPIKLTYGGEQSEGEFTYESSDENYKFHIDLIFDDKIMTEIYISAVIVKNKFGDIVNLDNEVDIKKIYLKVNDQEDVISIIKNIINKELDHITII